MKRTVLLLALAALVMPATIFACEFTQGETRYADWAKCRYGQDAIVIVNLPEENSWEHCIYQVQAFMPAKLLAVTREENGEETFSANDRSQLGNPCYLTKQTCDRALEILEANEGY